MNSQLCLHKPIALIGRNLIRRIKSVINPVLKSWYIISQSGRPWNICMKSYDSKENDYSNPHYCILWKKQTYVMGMDQQQNQLRCGNSSYFFGLHQESKLNHVDFIKKLFSHISLSNERILKKDGVHTCITIHLCIKYKQTALY